MLSPGGVVFLCHHTVLGAISFSFATRTFKEKVTGVTKRHITDPPLCKVLINSVVNWLPKTLDFIANFNSSSTRLKI